MASVETSPVKATVSNPCPNCAKPLTDAAGLGWCSACGYCRSLEETPSKAELERKSPPVERDLSGQPTSQEPFLIPIWSLILTVGVIGLTAGSYYAGKQLAPNSFPRALWTSIQIAVGVLVLFVGQFIALMRIAPHDEKLSFKDAILPFRLYGHVFQRLPGASLSVCTLSWGLTLIAAGLFFVGGLGHWFTYIKSNKDRGQATSTKR